MTTSVPDVDVASVTEWFRTLYHGCGGHLHVACSGNWTGRTFSLEDGELPDAVIYIAALAEDRPAGIYARVTTLRQPPSEGARGRNTLSASLPALWADIDIDHPSHKHTACAGGQACEHRDEDGRRRHVHRVLPLPPDEVTARAIIEDTVLPAPSVWIHSGGGLYPLWLIDPVHHISDDLTELAALSAEWQHIIAAAAERAGWHYGTGVGDLARVLRVPGTVNRKVPEDPRPCRILELTDSRYTLSDLCDALDQARQLLPEPEPEPVRAPGPPRVGGDVKPGTDFARVDWSDALLLGRLHWRVKRREGPYREWLHPDATSELSATTGRGGFDNLFVFSTSTVFPVQQPISKLEAFRIIHGFPTHKDAVLALNRLGYGSPPEPRTLSPWPADATPTRPNGAHAAQPPFGEIAPKDTEATEPDEDGTEEGGQVSRRIVLTCAADIDPLPVRWGWRDHGHGRIPVGEITLIPGREGVGKSLFLAWMIANLTRGTLPGAYEGVARTVLYSTAEDSWNHTVVPRLIAANADLTKVFRVEVQVEDLGRTKLILPRDCGQLAETAAGVGAAALVCDPIISLIDDKLSVNQSNQLRQALEPLRNAAERAGVMVVALAHFNKMVDVDILTKIPGARAWAEVARAALALAHDEDQGLYVASQIKNNLGRTDLTNLTYQIEPILIETRVGPAETAKLVWTGTTPTGVGEILGKRKPASGEKSTEVVEFVTAVFAATGQLVPVARVVEGLPHMSDKAVKQALTRAVNRDHLLERPMHGHYKPVDPDPEPAEPDE